MKKSVFIVNTTRFRGTRPQSLIALSGRILILSAALVFSAMSGFAAESDVPGWSFKSDGRGAEVKLTYDASKIKEGDAAMYIIPDSNDGEFVISQKVATESGSTYKLVANIIGTKLNGVSIKAGDATVNVRNGTSAVYRPTTAYSVEWTATGASYDVSLIIAGNSEAVYADEFALYKDGDETVNLLENPGFEDGADRTAPGEVVNPAVTEGEAKLTFRWTDPSDEDLDKIIITRLEENGEITDDTYEIEKGVGKLEIDGLEEWTEYTYLIRTKDNTLGNISEGTKITATTRGITYKTGEYAVEDGKVSVTVENVAEESFTAELAVLSYDADGRMIAAVSSGKQPIDISQTVTLSAEYEIPEGGYAKVFLWDGVYQMRCLKPSERI